MTCNAHLCSQGHVISQPATACNRRISNNNAAPANRHVMPNLDKVVDLGALAYPGYPEPPPVNGCIGSDFNIIINLDKPEVFNFPVCLPVKFETKPIRTKNCPGMYDDCSPIMVRS